jgi:hypothetical protein
MSCIFEGLGRKQRRNEKIEEFNAISKVIAKKLYICRLFALLE